MSGAGGGGGTGGRTGSGPGSLGGTGAGLEAPWIRAIGPQDAPALADLHAGLSDESRYLRFFSPHRTLTADELCHWIELDGRLHAGVGAFLGARCIGHALYDVRRERPTEAEVALEVLDAFQGQGIGTRMLHALIPVARAAGFHRLTATVLPENKPMLRVFRDLGLPERARYVDGVVRVEMELGEQAGAAGAGES